LFGKTGNSVIYGYIEGDPNSNKIKTAQEAIMNNKGMRPISTPITASTRNATRQRRRAMIYSGTPPLPALRAAGNNNR
jgi:hypothetical protein